MTNNTFLLPIAAAILLVVILIVLLFIKPRKPQEDFIVGLLNKLAKTNHPE